MYIYIMLGAGVAQTLIALYAIWQWGIWEKAAIANMNRRGTPIGNPTIVSPLYLSPLSQNPNDRYRFATDVWSNNK